MAAQPVPDASELESFALEMDLPSIVVPVKKTAGVLKVLRAMKILAYYPAFNNILPDPDGKRLLLVEGTGELPDEVKTEVGDVQITKYHVRLDYHNLSYPDLLTHFLPNGMVIPTSFETIGHIAHLNLLDDQIPYKFIIGKAILLKNPQLKTVAIKVGNISNVYRSMNLEVIAGEPNFVTEVHQSSLTFRMDFSKVYWNSRLEHEHDGLVETFQKGSLVADAMCGIGPFAVRAALRKGCHVKANDLNPDSYYWLKENCKINKVEDKVECFNLDARVFIKQVFKDGGCDYIVMNLPATAVEFLDAVGEAAVQYRSTARLPIVHFHAFDDKESDFETSLRRRAEAALKMPLPPMKIHKVRDVSPGKDMFRCSFNTAELFHGSEPAPVTVSA